MYINISKSTCEKISEVRLTKEGACGKAIGVGIGYV